jgi:site-specific DNA-cytosine methylase
MHAAFGYARLHKPKIIVGENVSNIGVGSEGQIWRSLLAILHAAGDYEWAWQVLDPTTSLREDVPMNRSRFWYMLEYCVVSNTDVGYHTTRKGDPTDDITRTQTSTPSQQHQEKNSLRVQQAPAS